MAWRRTPFSPDEQEAIIRAASKPFSLGYPETGKEPERSPWTVHCVLLDSLVPPPPGFDGKDSYLEWESLTPFVPPRHAYKTQGQPKPGEDPETQLKLALERLEYPEPSGLREIELHAKHWVKVHAVKRSKDGPSNQSRRGYRFRLTFPKPVSGPIALGHSSHFGLGLFVPVDE